jgi:hypothetical protein
MLLACPPCPPCLQLRLSSAEGQLAEAQAEREQLRHQLARVGQHGMLGAAAAISRSLAAAGWKDLLQT